MLSSNSIIIAERFFECLFKHLNVLIFIFLFKNEIIVHILNTAVKIKYMQYIKAETLNQ